MRTLYLQEDLGDVHKNLHPKTLDRMAARGELPKPVRVGRKKCWFINSFFRSLPRAISNPAASIW